MARSVYLYAVRADLIPGIIDRSARDTSRNIANVFIPKPVK